MEPSYREAAIQRVGLALQALQVGCARRSQNSILPVWTGKSRVYVFRAGAPEYNYPCSTPFLKVS